MSRTAVILAALCCIPTAAFAQDPQTDVIGEDNQNRDGSASFKLNAISPRVSVQLDELEAYLDPLGDAEIHFVVYEPGISSDWSLIYGSGLITINGGETYHSSGPINIILEGGTDYAIGVFIPDGKDITYFYGGAPPQDLGWGTVLESQWSGNGDFPFANPEPQIDLAAGDPYRQRITVSFGPDADGDGVGSLNDCDDNDADTFFGAEEICDGKDNDCDGALGPMETTDEDGDGSPSCADCDDTNAEIYPGAEDLCNGVDNNCDGIIPLPGSCDDATGTGTGAGTGNGGDEFADEELVAKGCACDGTGPAPGSAALLALAVLGLRRRRVN